MPGLSTPQLSLAIGIKLNPVRDGVGPLQADHGTDKLAEKGPGKIVRTVSGQGVFMKLFSGGRLAVAAALVVSGLLTTQAFADVVVQIDKSSQRMSVSVNGAARYTWPVSTGRSGYGTPSGTFHPQMMARRWFSRKYYNSPMPYSIFFYHGFAIHGTNDLGRLGGPASHGCVRLHPSHAAALYALVERNGRGSTRIEIY